MVADGDEKTMISASMTVSPTQTRSTKAVRSAGSFDPELQALSPNRTKDAALERRIKEGSSGLELLEYAKSLYDINDVEATAKIHQVIQVSSDAIKNTFSQDQVVMMAFHLYETALNGGRIKDAAMVLQSISVMLRAKGIMTPEKPEEKKALEVQVLEYLPEPE